jgi:hypothetical protein
MLAIRQITPIPIKVQYHESLDINLFIRLILYCPRLELMKGETKKIKRISLQINLFPGGNTLETLVIGWRPGDNASPAASYRYILKYLGK